MGNETGTLIIPLSKPGTNISNLGYYNTLCKVKRKIVCVLTVYHLAHGMVQSLRYVLQILRPIRDSMMEVFQAA